MDAAINPPLIVKMFENAGGDPSRAIASARKFNTVQGWTAWQMLPTAAVGGAAMAVPVWHVPALAVDVSVLFHKMTTCVWGIGAVLGCPVDAKDDLAIILGMWCGAIKGDALDAAINTAVGGAMAGVAGAALVYPSFAAKIASQALAVGLKEVGVKVGAKPAAKAAAKVAEAFLPPLGGQIVQKFAVKLAAKLSAKVTAKTVLSFVAGFGPLLGPAAGVGINLWFMHRISDEADLYYKKKLAYQRALAT